MRIPYFRAHLLLLFLTTLLSGCPGGGGGGGGNSNNTGSSPSFTFDDFIPITAVALDRQTGTLPAGSIVPLACVIGGTVAGPEPITPTSGCDSDHLHFTIGISGIGSGFTDVALPFCGHGKVGITFKSLLTHTCSELDDAQLAVIADDLAPYSNIFLSLIDGSDTKYLIGDIKNELRAGLNPINYDIPGGITSVAGELDIRCDRGMNPTTMQNEIEHYKISLDYPINSQLQVKLPFCRKYADITTGGVNIDLANNSGGGGDFFTGRRGTMPMPLSDGINNMLSFDVRNTETERLGFVLSYDSPSFKGIAFKYNPLGNETIKADATTLTPTVDVNVDDSGYQLNAEYKGIKAFGLGTKLSQNFYSLDSSTPPRTIPTIQGLSSLGGIYKYKAEFEATESGTGRTQSASIKKYFTDELNVQYTEPQPPYITDGSLTLTDDPGVGFNISMSYSPGPSYLNYDLYKVSVRAEVLDSGGGTPTLHQWKVDNYRWGATGNTDVTWPSSYISGQAGGNAPTMADITRLKYSAANDDAIVRRSLYPDRPEEEIDRTIGFTVGYSF